MFGFKLNLFTRIWSLVSLGLLVAAGCVPLDATPIPEPTRPTPCLPSAGSSFYTANSDLVGIQNQKAMSQANNIYNLYLNNPNDLELARSEAINFLAYETRRWSHLEDLEVDDKNSVRVVATFISPELIQAVLLNHALYNLQEAPLAGLSLVDYSNKILAAMDERKKFLFLLSIQPVSLNQSRAPIHVPASQVVLANNSGIRANVSNDDNFLNQTFDFSSDPHAGLLFYPFGKANGEECQPVLDPLLDTSITLSIQAQLGTETKTITWEIPFAPPLPVPVAIPTADPNLMLVGELKTPLEDPPVLPLRKPLTMADWRVLGRFVWGKMTYAYFPAP